MKKLVFAAVLASSMFVMADEAAKTEAAPAKTVEATRAARPQLTDEQRAQMKARRDKFLAERKARMEEMKAKMLETIKKYVPEEEKAKALLAELEKLMPGMRRPMPGMRPPMNRTPKAQPAETK